MAVALLERALHSNKLCFHVAEKGGGGESDRIGGAVNPSTMP